jgi:hypothetical protein
MQVVLPALSGVFRSFPGMAMVIVFGLGSIPPAGAFAETETEPGFMMGVDPRIELLAVVQSLTSWPDIGAFTDLESQYRTDVRDRFAPFADHPAVAWFEENLQNGWSFDAPPTAMLHLSTPPELEVVLPFSNYLIARGQGQENLQEMVRLLRDFATDTDFMAFWDEQQAFYRRFVQRIENQIPFATYTADMEAFYGEQKSRFVFVPAPLFHSGGYGMELDKGGETVAYYIGGPHALEDGFPVFRQPALRRLVFHEFGHAFVNSLVYAHSEELEKYDSLFTHIAQSMGNLGYGNWPTAFHEHVIRAGESLLLRAAGFADEAAEAYDANLVSYGFKLLPFVTSGLEEYQSDRKTYGSFREYFPELLAVLGEVEWVTRPGPGPMSVYLNINQESCSVVQVHPDSPFGRAGAQSGDLIESLSGIPADGNSFTQIKKMWQDATPGDRFQVVFVRGDRRITAEVEVPAGEVSEFAWKDRR